MKQASGPATASTGAWWLTGGIITRKNIEEIVDVRGLDLVDGIRMNNGFAHRGRVVPLDEYSEPFIWGGEGLQAY